MTPKEIETELSTGHKHDEKLSYFKACDIYFHLDSTVTIIDFLALGTHCMKEANARTLVRRQGEAKEVYATRISAYIVGVS